MQTLSEKWPIHNKVCHSNTCCCIRCLLYDICSGWEWWCRKGSCAVGCNLTALRLSLVVRQRSDLVSGGKERQILRHYYPVLHVKRIEKGMQHTCCVDGAFLPSWQRPFENGQGAIHVISCTSNLSRWSDWLLEQSKDVGWWSCMSPYTV